MHRDPTQPVPAIYLVIHMHVRDPKAAMRYATAVRPLVERFGGEILALSTRGGQPVEGEPRAEVVAVHRWPSGERFQEFYDSPEYVPLKRLRHASCDTRIVALDALPGADGATG